MLCYFSGFYGWLAIYGVLSQSRICRNLHFFGANFFWPKIYVCYFYYFLHLCHHHRRQSLDELCRSCHRFPDLTDGDLLEQVHLDQLPYQTKHQPPFRHGLNMFSSSKGHVLMIFFKDFTFCLPLSLSCGCPFRWSHIPLSWTTNILILLQYYHQHHHFVIILSSASSFCHYIINIVINTLQSYEQGWDFHAAWRWRFSSPCWSPVNLWNCRMITSVQRTVQLKPTDGHWASQTLSLFWVKA